jgi:DNA-binding response OmpR family regulator
MNSSKRDAGYLLLVEDEQAVQENNMKILKRRGYEIKQAYSLEEARNIIKVSPPKGIILDLRLPDGSGLEFLQELRKKSSIPVLILTAMGERDDILSGFQYGSDDYLTKPYDLSLFLMRVEALLRRADAIPEELEYSELKLFPISNTAMLNGVDMLLSQKEYALLQLFVQNPDKILSAEYLYEKVWGHEMIEKDTSLKVTISKLRNKLDGSSFKITASRREGYYLERDG